MRQGLLALPFRFGAGVTHRLLAADSGEEKQKDLLKPQLGAFWYLDYMAVDCAAQSRGLGSRTLSLCIRQAQVRSLGSRHLQILVPQVEQHSWALQT